MIGRRYSPRWILLGLLVATPTSVGRAATIFPEDGSLRAGRWWVSPDSASSLVPFDKLELLLARYGIRLGISKFTYTYLQDVLLFDRAGHALLQSDMAHGDSSSLSSDLRDLTLGIYNGEERRLTRYTKRDATLDGQPSRPLRGTLVEGGALITGRKTDGSTYAITPVETLKRTQSFLGLSEAQARQAIADDFEISVQNLITLSPTAGHLDLSIQAFPGGVVLVHDPRALGPFLREALRDPLALPAERMKLEEMLAEAEAERHSHYQTLFDTNAESLRAAGLKVIRVAGRFSTSQPWLNTRRSFERVNFLNGTVLRGANDELLVLTNRAENLPSLERLWAKKLAEWTGLAEDNVHYLGSYALGAGLDCIGATSP